MAIHSNEFCEKFKTMFGLPDNLIEFKIIGKVDNLVYVECTTLLQSPIEGLEIAVTKRYKLVEADD